MACRLENNPFGGRLLHCTQANLIDDAIKESYQVVTAKWLVYILLQFVDTDYIESCNPKLSCLSGSGAAASKL